MTNKWHMVVKNIYNIFLYGVGLLMIFISPNKASINITCIDESHVIDFHYFFVQ